MKSVRLIVAALFCVVLAACSQSQQANTGGRNPWTIPGTLRWGQPDEPDSLNPLFAHTAATDTICPLIYAYLLAYDDNGEFIPDLATAVPSYANGGISKDSKTISFHLRKGAKWADGAPLTAKDWLFTYHSVFNAANNTKSRYGWDDIASAESPDDLTLVIHLKKVNAGILGLFAQGGDAYPPLPAHILARLPDINKAPFNNRPLSSGPFILQAWNHGSSLVFTANPEYYRGRPKLDKIVWKVIPDTHTLFNQMQTHEIDVYPTVTENDIARLPQIKGIVVNKKLIATWRHLGINTKKPILHDVRVRYAIAEANDWKRINDTIYHGYNQLAVSDVYPNSWAAPNIPRYPYDPEAAKKLLAQAGWTLGPDGILHKGSTAMHLSISTGTNKQENTEAEVQIQGQLKAIGIDVTIHNYAVNYLFARDGPLYTGKYDLEWSASTNGPEPDNSGSWESKYIPPNGANDVWISDPIIDQTAEAALLTFDRAKRKALYQKEEERIHQLVPAVFFYWEISYTAINTDVKNYKPAAFISDAWNAWQWSI
ncbi:MAG: peptide ABC transporter substrate-binding protein [Candidatus Eremiobacteraeota bacterium]|nr:peptide ABC transporter substrate-binding protein [Candidatus Eremiobacteraeota bacterium]